MAPLRILTLIGILVLAAEAAGADFYDPLAYARAHRQVQNREAVVPAQCYTKTEGRSNPCYACHTAKNGLNSRNDYDLQASYDFSDFAMVNRWSNLFAERSSVTAQISPAEVTSYVQEDNYTPLVRALSNRDDYPGYVPDLDFSQGFDSAGFAEDQSGWRAIRYKPFLGTFWPTNGSSSDVMIRLPEVFRVDAEGKPSRDIYRLNLAVLEAAMSGDPNIKTAELVREVEPLDEGLAGVDLDGDGVLGLARFIRGLPEHYFGGAASVPVQRYLYPEGSEFLHTVRYLDPDAPSMLAQRMKEVRYSKKVQASDIWSVNRAYEREFAEKEEGKLPAFAGSPEVGLRNDFGWQLQGFIEDPEGRLRLQTQEEHLFCMGCHSNIGVTADQTFAFPRKVPGAAGWRHQDLAGIPDVPQVTQSEGEILTYFTRVGGGDELRENQEILSRFFPDGRLDRAKVLQARDITDLVVPSRQRAFELNRAYMALVRTGDFALGRDTHLEPAQNVHRRIGEVSTGLEASDLVYQDGVLFLDWSQPAGK